MVRRTGSAAIMGCVSDGSFVRPVHRAALGHGVPWCMEDGSNIFEALDENVDSFVQRQLVDSIHPTCTRTAYLSSVAVSVTQASIRLHYLSAMNESERMHIKEKYVFVPFSPATLENMGLNEQTVMCYCSTVTVDISTQPTSLRCGVGTHQG